MICPLVNNKGPIGPLEYIHIGKIIVAPIDTPDVDSKVEIEEEATKEHEENP
jgi:hypothetical protein